MASKTQLPKETINDPTGPNKGGPLPGAVEQRFPNQPTAARVRRAPKVEKAPRPKGR